jgi:Uma2 family endonuclease
MADAARRPMTPEEFFRWQLDQDDLYELVDGVPVKMLKMMTGASHQHDLVVVNVISLLRAQLRGTRCRPTTDDIAVRTRIRSVRRPDVTVECAEPVRDTYETREPKLVVEVLSPSTTNIDRFRRLEEYKQHPTLAYVLLIDTREPMATLYTRTGERDWRTEDFTGLEATIALPEIGATLSLREVYEDLSFAEASDPG